MTLAEYSAMAAAATGGRNTAGHLMDLVRQSDVVSVLSDSMLAGETAGGLAPLPVTGPRQRHEISSFTHTNAVPPLASRFLEILRCTT